MTTTDQFCSEVLLFKTLQASINDKHIFLKNLLCFFTIEERISLLMDKAPEDEVIQKKIFKETEEVSSLEIHRILMGLSKREKRIFIRALLKEFSSIQVADILIQ